MHQAERYFYDVSFLHNLSLVYEDEGKLDKANSILESAIHMSPKNTRIRFAQVLFYQRTGKTEKAYQSGLELLRDIKRTGNPSNPLTRQIVYELKQLTTSGSSELP